MAIFLLWISQLVASRCFQRLTLWLGLDLNHDGVVTWRDAWCAALGVLTEASSCLRGVLGLEELHLGVKRRNQRVRAPCAPHSNSVGIQEAGSACRVPRLSRDTPATRAKSRGRTIACAPGSNATADVEARACASLLGVLCSYVAADCVSPLDGHLRLPLLLARGRRSRTTS